MKTIEVRSGVFLKIIEEVESHADFKNFVRTGKVFSIASKSEKIEVKVNGINTTDILDVYEWCTENTEYFGIAIDGHEHTIGFFINEIDAMAFKLRFG